MEIGNMEKQEMCLKQLHEKYYFTLFNGNRYDVDWFKPLTAPVRADVPKV
jgi:hypothetical protein